MSDDKALDPRWETYIEWLTTAPSERVPSSKEKYAELHGVSVWTLRRWQKRPEFVRRWDEEARLVVGSPERTQEVLDVLYLQAKNGDVKSAQLFLTATGKMQPPAPPSESKGGLESMSDEELREFVGRLASAESEKRAAAVK